MNRTLHLIILLAILSASIFLVVRQWRSYAYTKESLRTAELQFAFTSGKLTATEQIAFDTGTSTNPPKYNGFDDFYGKNFSR